MAVGSFRRRPRRYSASRRGVGARGGFGYGFDRFGALAPAGVLPGSTAPGGSFDPFTGQGAGNGVGASPNVLPVPTSSPAPTAAPTPALSPAPLIDPVLEDALTDPSLAGAVNAPPNAMGLGGNSLDPGLVDLAGPLPATSPLAGPNEIVQQQVNAPVEGVPQDTFNQTTTGAAASRGAPQPGAPAPTSSWSGSDTNSTNSSSAGTGAQPPSPMANPLSGSEGTPAGGGAPLVYSPQMGWVTIEQLFAGYHAPDAPAQPSPTSTPTGYVPSSGFSGSDQNPGAGQVIAPSIPQSGWSGSDMNQTNSSATAPQKTAEDWIRELGGNALVFDHGGVINETVWGIGESGKKYVFAANGKPETVTPGVKNVAPMPKPTARPNLQRNY